MMWCVHMLCVCSSVVGIDMRSVDVASACASTETRYPGMSRDLHR